MLDHLDPSNCSCAMLQRGARKVTRAYELALRPAGLTPNQFTLLTIISRLEVMSVNQLADIIGCERTTLSRNLKPLIRDGFIETDTGQDQRIKKILITSSGREKQQTAETLWTTAQDDLVSKLGISSWSKLMQLLTELDQASIET